MEHHVVADQPNVELFVFFISSQGVEQQHCEREKISFSLQFARII
jgi:hypothetical protein